MSEATFKLPEPTAFDYGCLDPAQAKILRKTAAQIRKTGHDTFLEIGRELLKVKEWLAHGRFVQWVECECGIGIRMAQRAMAAARVVAKNDKLSCLPVDALIALGDTEIIPGSIISDIDAGRTPTAASVKAALRTEEPKTGDANSQAPDTTTEPEQQDEALPATLLAELTALWDRADVETRTVFRQQIGCG